MTVCLKFWDSSAEEESMDREVFYENLKSQYVQQLQKAYSECVSQVGACIDMPKLNRMLNKLMAQAEVEGLSRAEFSELMMSTLPHVADQMQLEAPAKKAA